MAGANFLVRHGQDGGAGLTPEGVQQAEAARDTLLDLGLGSTAVLLSSSKQRALLTAEIIGAGLSTPVHPSERINIAGNDAGVVRDLDDFLAETLRQLDVARADDQPLVVVTHAPLVAIAKGLSIRDTGQVRNGEVVNYVPGTWNSAFYRQHLEEGYAEGLKADRG